MEPDAHPDVDEQRPAGDDPGLASLDAAPGLLRISGRAWLRTAEWTVGTAIRTGRRLTEAALGSGSPGEFLDELRHAARDGARHLLGATEIEGSFAGAARRRREGDDSDPESLRERGAALLNRSADLGEDGGGHPAFDRILTQLAPDEARILRLIATNGAQPAVDVRTWRPLNLGSHIVAPGLSMIGKHAGCIHEDRVPAYLANLFRLGLIWFSRDPMRDLKRYEVLEAQPPVTEAMQKAGRARTVRRSIQLTPFGRHFCDYCLPLDTAEFEALGATATDEAVPQTPDEASPIEGPGDESELLETGDPGTPRVDGPF